MVTAKVKTGDLDVYLSGLGTVTALNTVTFKEPSGRPALDKVLFQEGQMGEHRPTVSGNRSRPFQVQLAQAGGQLVRDQALLTNAQTRFGTVPHSFKEDSIPKQQLDTQESLVRQFEGTIKADQSQVDNASCSLFTVA